MNLAYYWLDSVTDFLTWGFSFLPDVPVVNMASYVTSEVSTGMNWLAFFIPVNTLVTIFVGWMAVVVAMTSFNLAMSVASFVRG